MASFIGAIDQGTTSTRFIVFDHSGRIVTSAQKEHRQIYPQPGWVEHDPEEIWQQTQEMIQEAMQAGGLHPEDLAGIGITNQRETAVVWHKKTGKPIHNAIVWQDTRVAPEVAEFAANDGQQRYQSKTGLPLSTYLQQLKYASAGQRAEIVRAVGSFGSDAAPAVDPVMQALGDADPDVRSAAAWAFSQMAGAGVEAVPALER